MTSNWKLSPSELTFLWDDCPRCFYLKVVRKFNRPWGAFPKIFNRIDKLMKDHYEGKSTSEIAPELPEGIVQFGEKWVTSAPISIPGHEATCFIRGKFDTVVAFSDGSYGVVDFKTSQPRPEHVAFYGRQLHAYAYALEHPTPNSLALAPITRLGLLCVEPVSMDKIGSDQLAYIGDVTWLEVPKDNSFFTSFLDNVLTVLEKPTPPDSNPKCGYCQYRMASRETGY